MEQITLTLKAIRVNLGLSLEEASILIGISSATLSNYERGESYPDVPIIKRIEKVYNVPFERINFFLNDTVLNVNNNKEEV